MGHTPLRIAIDARISTASAGGVGPVVFGLIQSLGQLRDGSEEYVIVVDSARQADALRYLAGPNQAFAVCQRPFSSRVMSRLAPRLKHVSRFLGLPASQPHVEISSGFYESLGCDVVHFPHQNFVICGLPSIFNPHDLQHLHFPQFFSPHALAQRELTYRTGCQHSQYVAVASKWVQDDIISNYGLDRSKVQIIPWAPPTVASSSLPTEESLKEVRLKYCLPEEFAFFPAMAWPHKNHMRLFEALAHLRDNFGLRVPLVCSGSMYEPHASRLRIKCRELHLESQIQFLGFVPDQDMRAIYRQAQFLIMPTLFESDSSPIYEAWLEELPVICSNVTALPDQVQDAALLFDPYRSESIADSIREVTSNAVLRESLKQRGTKRLKEFQWSRTATAYRALYRLASRRALSPEDEAILKWDWMRSPNLSLLGPTS